MTDTLADIWQALAPVEDPEIRRPLIDLGMIPAVDYADGVATVSVLLTVSGCPMRNTITDRITAAAMSVAGVDRVSVQFDVMSDEQRQGVRRILTGGQERENPFTRAGNLTRVIAVASGKGGVGKSSVTANLAVALANQGFSVGLIDADVYGHSIPRLMSLTAAPTYVEGLFMPPVAHGVRVMSILPFKPGGATEAVAYRGPMLHKVLQQFLTDTWWGDLDFLLLDLPPGTGDMPMSIGQTLPNAEVLIVTTAHAATAEVAVRSGVLAHQLRQRIMGVVENMSYAICAHCGERSDIFGAGGADVVSTTLSEKTGSEVPVLARIPFDDSLANPTEGAAPFVAAHPQSTAATALIELATMIARKPRGLVGMPLAVSPTRRD